MTLTTDRPARPTALVILPLPLDIPLFRDAIGAAERAWRRAGRHRRPMTTAHMREETVLGGRALVVYDMPVTGQLPPEVAEVTGPADPAGQQTTIDAALDER